MHLQLLKKDVGRALLTLERVPLKYLRTFGGNIIKGGSKDDNSNDARCEKCKEIIAQTFGGIEEPVMFADAGKREEEKLAQKIETIVEQPLIDAEPKDKGFNIQPNLLANQYTQSPIECERQNRFETSLTCLDDLACKLMNIPPKEIDTKLLDKKYTTQTKVDDRVHGVYQIRDTEKTEAIQQNVNSLCSELDDNSLNKVLTGNKIADNSKFHENITMLPQTCFRNYELNINQQSLQYTWIPEKTQPKHTDIVYPNYLHKFSAKGMVRKKRMRGGNSVRQEFLAYGLTFLPLPPTTSSISSNSDIPLQNPKEDPEDTEPTSISYKTLPKPGKEGDLKRGRQYKVKFEQISPEIIENTTCISTVLPHSISIENMTYPEEVYSTFDPITKQNLIEANLPLSEVLKKVRLRNKVEQELSKKQKTFDVNVYMSKATCWPPLDLRPRAKTCPPPPCPPPPCPPPPCPPPKKDPCAPKPKCPPPKKDKCDPCKPPPSCPPKKCGMYSGNKFKNTITLILCSFSSVVGMGHVPPILLNVNSTINESTIRNYATKKVSPTLHKQTMEWSAPKVDQKNIQDTMKARGFEPWAPIPSWPTPKKEVEKRLVCPQEGCKLPKHSNPPCKELPCSPKAADRKPKP